MKLLLSMVAALAIACSALGSTSVTVTAKGGAYWRVYVDGVEVSKHTAQHKAQERATNEAIGAPEATVEIHASTVFGVVATIDDPDPDPEPDPDPDPDPPAEGAITGGNLRLLGGYRIPFNSIGGSNARFSGPGLDYNPTLGAWVMRYGVGGHVAELLEQGPPGEGPADEWPELTIGRHGQPFSTVDKISPGGVLWLDENRVLCSGRKSYRSGFEPNWLSVWNLETGEEELVPMADPDRDDGGNFHLLQSFGAGLLRIPQAFADAHTGGRTIGAGRGGYDVLGSPLGPALAAINLEDPFPQRVLIDHPDKTPAYRNRNYQFPESDSAQLGMWKDPDEVRGYWIAGNVGQPAWVPGRAVVFPCHQVDGTIDYRAQGDWGGNIGLFGVEVPEVFYNANEGPNRGNHQAETWNADLPPAVPHFRLYSYPPSQLAEVLAGDREQHLCEPTISEFPREGIPWSRTTQLAGIHYTGGRLWALVLDSLEGKKPILACFEIVED